MNYYKELAQILGLQLLEEFKCLGSEAKYRISVGGLQQFNNNQWETASFNIIPAILKGDMAIVRTKREIIVECAEYLPRKNDVYYMCVPYVDRRNKISYIAVKKEWTDAYENYQNYIIGNCFRTEEEAKTEGREIVDRLTSEIIDRSK